MQEKNNATLVDLKQAFEAVGIEIGYFFPTATGLEKSIFDAKGAITLGKQLEIKDKYCKA